MLPLLREEQGSGASTVDERVIGAGLQTLKDADAPAVKRLFAMFAVTQEDFVHPMAVVELLWRSCCAADAEKQGRGLGTRLKVRQWTQLLVDQSLLLGSSSEGIHLHDIVLQYLRKRLTAEQMRAEHRKVVEGMMATSSERVNGLQNTGSTVRAHEGEEVDWYCCNLGAYHIRQARDPEVAVTDDEHLQQVLLGRDQVLVRAAAIAVGNEALATLVAHFKSREEWLKAAKVEWATPKSWIEALPIEASVRSLISTHKLDTNESHQLELTILGTTALFYFDAAEQQRIQMRITELMNDDDTLQIDPAALWVATSWVEAAAMLRFTPSHW